MKKNEDRTEASGLSRRSFLKRGGAGVAVGAGFPQIVPRHVIGQGQTPPSETVYVAGIGAGGMGGVDIRESIRAGAKIVALCDVDWFRARDAFEGIPEATRYKDYRILLDKEKGIDAVIVGTPDHVHAAITMAAMELGKHVYCEKPLAHTLKETRTVTEAARRFNVATQLGNQGRSFDSMKAFRDCIRAGTIGHVREVHIQEAGHSACKIDELPLLSEHHDVPETLDWNLWLGPAPHRAYHPAYLPGRWRGWSQFGSGMLGDWMCHLLDPVFWALELDAPTTVFAEAEGYDPERHRETFPRSTHARFEFPAKGDRPAVTVHWYDGDRYQPPRPDEIPEDEPVIPIPPASWAFGKSFGALVIGDEGKIVYGSHGAAGWRIIPDEKMQAYQEKHGADYEPNFDTLPSGGKHHEDWLAACKGEGIAGSNFDYGGPLTEVALAGNIAIRLLGTELEWDTNRFEFTNNRKANEYLHYAYRDGWTL